MTPGAVSQDEAQVHEVSSPLTMGDSPSPSPPPSGLSNPPHPDPPPRQVPNGPYAVILENDNEPPVVPRETPPPGSSEDKPLQATQREKPPISEPKPQTKPLDVDICFLRHLRSTSNVISPPGTAGLVLTDLTAHQVLSWAWHGVNQGTAQPVKRGEFLWDGLTEEGLATSLLLKEDWKKIEGVRIVISSPLTRSLQTAHEIFYCNALYLNQAFQEATNWPQDRRAHTYFEGGREFTSYIMLKGGDGPDCGEVVRREKVKVNDAHWLSSFPKMSREERLKDILTAPTQESIETRAANGRQLLYEMARKLEGVHRSRRQPGTPKLVCVTHGGMINFLTGDFYCSFRRDDDRSDWEWVTSSALSPGDTVVYRFQPTDDDPYNLTEKPRTEEYAAALGGRYKVLKDIGHEYHNPDGSLVDQKAEYMKFNKQVAEDVARVHARDPELFNYLLGVPGPTMDGEMGDRFYLARFQEEQNDDYQPAA
ncbi:hypothetical protein BGZ63DRAFT_152225 [Mariannaea sp. PMI_226]|nr:hypothetical protein BGZ63DRAFT_152225 [Mariannaea sp. PMI_226]